MKRREFLNLALLSGMAAASPYSASAQQSDDTFTRIIPSSGEPIPAVGLDSVDTPPGGIVMCQVPLY
ncbi:hypothetical protein [Hoeflea sp.]|uniref:hypothetical protein n=1 Tax=Hoeflea sp. TaxID=1940281 RepID=UPI003B02EC72